MKSSAPLWCAVGALCFVGPLKSLAQKSPPTPPASASTGAAANRTASAIQASPAPLPSATASAATNRPSFLRVLPMMKVLDVDQNGELSTAEIENAAANLKKLDTNQDGKLTEDELRPGGDRGSVAVAPRRVPNEAIDRFMAMDKNGDGKLTREELPERNQASLMVADENHDGSITREELVQFVQRGTIRASGGAVSGSSATSTSTGSGSATSGAAAGGGASGGSGSAVRSSSGTSTTRPAQRTKP